VISNVFYEPSTRTSSSFAVAMQRLGGSVIHISEVSDTKPRPLSTPPRAEPGALLLPKRQSTSSATKGETLSDTIACLSCYSDAIVLRHPIKGSAGEAAAASSVPVLNAGDGVGEHPTQALLDLYTIRTELGSLSGLRVTLVGDLKHGRTVHSLSRLLSMWPGTHITFVSPPELAMPSEIVEELTAAGMTTSSADSLSPSVVAATDVLYVTRVQKERFADTAEYERLKHAYVVTAETMTHAKARMAVLHPLPRVGEITVEVDADPRAAYFRQMSAGLHVRMALLALLMGATPEAIAAHARGH